MKIQATVGILRERFERHSERHAGIRWAEVEARLNADPAKLGILAEMERTGGEPDVTGRDEGTGTGGIWFTDCAAETPAGRVSLCYDRAGWESRKEHRPAGSAVEMAAAMGIELLTEEVYIALQALGEFDLKRSSWIATPPEIRAQGGALYAERRYGRVFIGHNGAQSYYAVRGFRGRVRV